MSAKDLANGGDGTGSGKEEGDAPAAKAKAPKKATKKGKAVTAAADEEPKAMDKKAAGMATFPNLKRKADGEEADGAEAKKVKSEGEASSGADAEGEDE